MSRMGSHVFFNGMALGETNQINIEEGKTLVVKYLGLGDRNEDGTRTVLFSKNRRMRASACFLFLCAGNVEKCGALFWPK